jgi:cytochrome c peroxidase
LLAVALTACTDDTQLVDGFTAAEWRKIRTLSPLPAVPPDPSNRYADDPRAAALGQKIFFEKGFSGPIVVADDGRNGGLGQVGETGKVSCATCHSAQNGWFDDNHRSQPDNVSLGLTWTTRNDPSLVNVAFYEWFGWGGRWDTLWMQFTATPESPVIGATRLGIARLMYRKYRDEYNAVFSPPLPADLDDETGDPARFPPAGKPKRSPQDPDGPWEKMAEADRQIVNRILVNCGKAVAAYQRRLVSRNAPFDRYVAGEPSALTPAQKRGLKLFISKAACDACHSGPFFTDQIFHVTGVPQAGEHVPATDLGRYTDQAPLFTSPFSAAGPYSDDPVWGQARLTRLGPITEADRGKFRTKNLRQIERTGPYMHTGALRTLKEVVEFYNVGGGDSGVPKDPKMVPLNLTPAEVEDLVEFLKSLTGEPVAPDLLREL